MELDGPMIPVIATNVLTAAVLGGVIWNRMGSIERATERLRSKIEEQNGRVDELEKWRERKEAWQRGWDDRKEREDGPQHE